MRHSVASPEPRIEEDTFLTNPYSHGPHTVTLLSVSSHGDENFLTRVFTWWKGTSSVNGISPNVVPPPKNILVAFPQAEGSFPVVQLQHGFQLKNSFYSQMMEHVSSHGYIVVAPQMYGYTLRSDVTNEIVSATAVLDWLPSGLQKSILSQTLATPNTAKVAMVGHSRGGKVAFGVALQIRKRVQLPISAIAGIDPVDGMVDEKSTPPPIITKQPGAFNLPFPTLIVGTGYGGERNCIFPPSVPKGVGHHQFYYNSAPPAYHFTAKRFGHLDMLNDHCGISDLVLKRLCKRGVAREPMRRWTGGLLVAFLDSALKGKTGELKDVFSKFTDTVPFEIHPPESK